jgi:hypothetical protein
MAKESKIRGSYTDDLWKRTNAALAQARRRELGKSLASPLVRRAPGKSASLADDEQGGFRDNVSNQR